MEQRNNPTNPNRPGESQSGHNKPGQGSEQGRPGERSKEGTHGGQNPSQQNPRDKDNS